MEKIKDNKEKRKDPAHELLEEMIRDGNKNYAETTCDVDRIRIEEHLAEKIKKKK